MPDSDAATDLEVDLGLAASIRSDVVLEQRAARSVAASTHPRGRNRSRNRSVTPAPPRPRTPARPPASRDEPLQAGVFIVLSAMVLGGGVALASVLGMVTALAARIVV